MDAVRQHLYIDTLFDEIAHYWHLSLDELETTPFDIEECLTLFQSLSADTPHDDRRLELDRASYAPRSLLLMYLSEMAPMATSPAARRFGVDVLDQSADVLTLNYDTVAEECIASATGIGPKPMPESLRHGGLSTQVSDEDLDASHLKWKRALSYGFLFDEVPLPIAGVPQVVERARYYAHPDNHLYECTRVLKLHGSIDWLRYTGQELYPGLSGEPASSKPPSGLVLDTHATYWLGGPPQRGPWMMEPRIIPPTLLKNYEDAPFPEVWEAALTTLSEASTLIVIGYSFPPTDFRVRRLFRESFAQHELRDAAIVNPDSSVANVVRELTGFGGPLVTCSDLPSFYGLPRDWFSE